MAEDIEKEERFYPDQREGLEDLSDIPKIVDRFAGEKYQFEDLINKKIVILDYQKEKSTKHPGGFYYKIQFVMLGEDGKKKILGFTTTGARQIVEVLEKKPPVPLYRTIIKKDKCILFKENIASTEEAMDYVEQKYNLDFNLL